MDALRGCLVEWILERMEKKKKKGENEGKLFGGCLVGRRGGKKDGLGEAYQKVFSPLRGENEAPCGTKKTLCKCIGVSSMPRCAFSLHEPM